MHFPKLLPLSGWVNLFGIPIFVDILQHSLLF